MIKIKPGYQTSVTPVYERDMKDDPAIGRTLVNGVIIMDKDLSPAQRVETASHEGIHAEEIGNGDFHWDDEKIYYKGKHYPKHLFAHGEGPWENRAYDEEIKTT
jgi:hypothetical protein